MTFTQELVRIAVEQDRKLQEFRRLVKQLELQVKHDEENGIFYVLDTNISVRTLSELYNLADSLTN